jgi:hypothetical protein
MEGLEADWLPSRAARRAVTRERNSGVDGGGGPRRRPVSSPLAGKNMPGSCWGVEKFQREPGREGSSRVSFCQCESRFGTAVVGKVSSQRAAGNSLLLED